MSMLKRLQRAAAALATAEETKVEIKVSGRTVEGMQFEGETDCTGSTELELLKDCVSQVKRKTGRIISEIKIIENNDTDIDITGETFEFDVEGSVIEAEVESDGYDGAVVDDYDLTEDDYEDDYEDWNE